jgi:paired amphipathic helix protein Sin3a
MNIDVSVMIITNHMNAFLQVVSNAVRQIQFCVTERNALECFQLYQNESHNHATGGVCSSASKRAAAELSYQRRAEALLQDDSTYFKIFIVS